MKWGTRPVFVPLSLAVNEAKSLSFTQASVQIPTIRNAASLYKKMFLQGDQKEMESCIDSPGDTRTALFRIDVIEIPINNPSASRIVSSPAVFADEETGELAGLWRGGDHGDPYETQSNLPLVSSTDIISRSPTIETSPCPPGQTTEVIKVGIPVSSSSYILKP